MDQKKLSVGTKLGFGAADLGGNLFFTAMGFWTLNYLTDSVGLSAAAAGAACHGRQALGCRHRPDDGIHFRSHPLEMGQAPGLICSSAQSRWR